MTREFFVVSPTSKSLLTQACSQGLPIDKYPPIQTIAYFQGDSILRVKLSPAPIFSCLFLGPGAHKAMERLILWCEAYAKKIPSPLISLPRSIFSSREASSYFKCSK